MEPRGQGSGFKRAGTATKCRRGLGLPKHAGPGGEMRGQGPRDFKVRGVLLRVRARVLRGERRMEATGEEGQSPAPVSPGWDPVCQRREWPSAPDEFLGFNCGEDSVWRAGTDVGESDGGEQGLATFRRCGRICRRRAWGGRAALNHESGERPCREPSGGACVVTGGAETRQRRPFSSSRVCRSSAGQKGEKSEVSSDSWDRKRKGIEVSWKGNDEGDGQEGSRDTGRVGGSRLKSGGGPR